MKKLIRVRVTVRVTIRVRVRVKVRVRVRVKGRVRGRARTMYPLPTFIVSHAMKKPLLDLMRSLLKRIKRSPDEDIKRGIEMSCRRQPGLHLH